MTNRKKLSDLKVELSDIHDIEITLMPTGNHLVFRQELTGDILFTVLQNDLLDADGHYFDQDL